METAIKEFDQDRISIQKMQVKLLPPGGGAGETPHMKEVGMLVGNFELNS